MVKHRKQRNVRGGVRWEVPTEIVELAKGRTDFLGVRVIDFDMPIRQALANAWCQGIRDAAQAVGHRLDNKTLLEPPGVVIPDNVVWC